MTSNGIYHLNNHTFGGSSCGEMICETLGKALFTYSLKSALEQDIELLEKIVAQILPDPLKRKSVMTFVSQCLPGKNIKHFGIFFGRNGMYFMKTFFFYM